MTASPDAPVLRELEQRLQGAIAGTVAFDPYTRVLYSTDGSIHEIKPLGVAFPREPDDLCALVETSASLGVPVLPRGAGTSLAGQAVGAALVIDCSRYLRDLLRLDPESLTAEVQPGLIAASLDRLAAPHGLMLGPDPASIDRASLGGMIGNNASGAHSIRYGMTADHVLFFPEDGRAHAIAGVALLVEECLTQAEADDQRPIDRLRFRPAPITWRLHGHCHAKSLLVSEPALTLMCATVLRWTKYAQAAAAWPGRSAMSANTTSCHFRSENFSSSPRHGRRLPRAPALPPRACPAALTSLMAAV